MLVTRSRCLAVGVMGAAVLILGALGLASTLSPEIDDWSGASELQTQVEVPQTQLESSEIRNVNVTTTYPYPVTIYDVGPDPSIVRGSGTWFKVIYFYDVGKDPQRQWDGSFYWVEVRVFDLTGRQVAAVTGQNCIQVWWSVGTLRNGAYIYRATVKDTWLGNLLTFEPFQGFVYIER